MTTSCSASSESTSRRSPPRGGLRELLDDPDDTLRTFLIAFVLGPLLEDNFRQSLLLSHGSLDIFVRNEICLIFWCLTVVAVVLIIRRRRRVPGTG